MSVSFRQDINILHHTVSYLNWLTSCQAGQTLHRSWLPVQQTAEAVSASPSTSACMTPPASESASHACCTTSVKYCIVQAHAHGYRGRTVQVKPLRTLISLYCECASCHQQEHVGSKTLLQQNPPDRNLACQLMQVVLHNGCKMAIVKQTHTADDCREQWIHNCKTTTCPLRLHSATEWGFSCICEISQH